MNGQNLQFMTRYVMIEGYRPKLCDARVSGVPDRQKAFCYLQQSAASVGNSGYPPLVPHFGRCTNGCGTLPFKPNNKRIHRPMTDLDSDSDSAESCPDSITLEIPIEDVYRLLAELKSLQPLGECPAIMTMVLSFALQTLPPLERVGVLRWLDELGRRRWQ